MAITDALATPEQYKADKKDSDFDDDESLRIHLAAVSRFLERECGQFFTKDAAVVARQFIGDGTCRLRLNQEGAPGIATTTDFVLKVDEDDDGSFSDETSLDNTTLLFLPLNAAAGPERRPYTAVELTSRSRLGYFPKGLLIEVTAIWGWFNIPKAVTAACIELTAIWRGESPRSTGNMQEIDELVSMSPMAMSLVKRFKLAYARAVVA